MRHPKNAALSSRSWLYLAVLAVWALTTNSLRAEEEDLASRNCAFREAKRDARLLSNQHAYKVESGPRNENYITDRYEHKIFDAYHEAIQTRLYHYNRSDGAHIVIQEHTAGHFFGRGERGNVKSHFNVREISKDPNRYKEDLRNSKVEGTKEHYPFKYSELEAIRYQFDRHDEPSPLTATRVGGIALEGAGEALRGLGRIDGVGIDQNGRLIMFAATGQPINLPALRLDDVVTVFRSVYIHGKAPSVSIDPDTKAVHPERSPMNVRHGKGTENTYVGWILFEADRLIKVFGQGRDNVTREEVVTSVPGYQSWVQCGIQMPSHPSRDDAWTRFWFAPSRVQRTVAPASALSLLDVSLEVKTESEVLRNGAFESIAGPVDECHKKTADWITEHYDDLERTVVMPLPSGHGLSFDRVNIFAELRRILLISAVAETLRDQAVLMPEWMRDYEVPPFPVPTQTPPLFVELPDSLGRMHGHWGGVRLDADAAVVTTVPAGPTDRARLPRILGAVQALPTGVPPGSLPSVLRLPESSPSRTGTPAGRLPGNKSYQVGVLPGNETIAAGAAEVNEVDLAVPVGDRAIEHRRRFHSFFRSAGEFGGIWSIELPRLSRERGAALAGDPDRAPTFVYRITSPLGTYSEVFIRTTFIPKLGRQLLAPEHDRDYVALAMNTAGEYLVYLKDGRRWRLNPQGWLIEQEDHGFVVRYRRDAGYRLVAIDGDDGAGHKATIELSYDASGRIIEATGPGARARYTYGADGHLASVDRYDGKHEYRYQKGLVTEIRFNGDLVRTLEYGRGGTLAQEDRFHGTNKQRFAYKVQVETSGTRVRREYTDGRFDEAVFDLEMRPLRRTDADGSTTEWRHGKGGTTEIRFTVPRGGQWLIKPAADGQLSTWRSPTGKKYEVRTDSDGFEAEVQ